MKQNWQNLIDWWLTVISTICFLQLHRLHEGLHVITMPHLATRAQRLHGWCVCLCMWRASRDGCERWPEFDPTSAAAWRQSGSGEGWSQLLASSRGDEGLNVGRRQHANMQTLRNDLDGASLLLLRRINSLSSLLPLILHLLLLLLQPPHTRTLLSLTLVVTMQRQSMVLGSSPWAQIPHWRFHHRRTKPERQRWEQKKGKSGGSGEHEWKR